MRERGERERAIEEEGKTVRGKEMGRDQAKGKEGEGGI